MRLYQVADCPSNEAVFICTNEEGPVIFWEISKRSNQVQFYLNTNFQTIGTVMREMMAPSLLSATLVSGNSSFVHSSLTITEPLNIDSSTINCNEEIVVLNSSKLSIKTCTYPTSYSYLYLYKLYIPILKFYPRNKLGSTLKLQPYEQKQDKKKL